jgi:hypothetical protein
LASFYFIQSSSLIAIEYPKEEREGQSILLPLLFGKDSSRAWKDAAKLSVRATNSSSQETESQWETCQMGSTLQLENKHRLKWPVSS